MHRLSALPRRLETCARRASNPSFCASSFNKYPVARNNHVAAAYSSLSCSSSSFQPAIPAVSSLNLSRSSSSAAAAAVQTESEQPSSSSSSSSSPSPATRNQKKQPAPPPVNLTAADKQRLSVLRNIGISAHIDSGKTTLTERVLFYTGRIKAIHEVRGKDAVGAKMDHMELEREKGITIQSAATYCNWKVNQAVDGTKDIDYNFNIIDTPGHVDFTIEVERALRVLDGAVLVLCSVSGVQSQTITVDRQMKRYNVPRICFINKMDRAGANPWRVIDQIRNKLKYPCAAVQVPIGLEDNHEGIIDLIRWKSIKFEGVKGIKVVESDEIPEDVLELAKEKRQELIETIADFDDEIANAYLDEREITPVELNDAIRRVTIARKFTPVYMGSALADIGVQPLLDGVCAYLPSPTESPATAVDISQPNEPVLSLVPASKAPLVGLAFKLEEGKYGQLTYMRIYQGTLKRGAMLTNVRTGKKVRIPRLVRMHSDEMEDVDSISAGEICAMFGVDCSSGDSFTDGTVPFSMSSMFVPDPVVSLAIKQKGTETPAFSKALARFRREDPTFRVHIDKESNETIISGMGELHLDIYIERMKREYNVETITGKPQVAFREQITKPIPFTYTHKKQSGGSGQYAKVIGQIEPVEMNEDGTLQGNGQELQFECKIVGAAIPAQYIPAVEKGFKDACERGALGGFPVIRAKYVLEDGTTHPVDSSELAFRLAGSGSSREVFSKGDSIILEPVMKVEVVAPIEYQGTITSSLNQRRGNILDTDSRDDDFTVIAEVPLNEMFGYSSTLRGSTQGKGEFSMEYCKHAPTTASLQKELADAYKVLIGKK